MGKNVSLYHIASPKSQKDKFLFTVLSDIVLFRFLSFRVFPRLLSDIVFFRIPSVTALFESYMIGFSPGSSVIASSLGLSVLLFSCATIFLSKCATIFLLKTDVLFFIIFLKRCPHLAISLTSFDKFQEN